MAAIRSEPSPPNVTAGARPRTVGILTMHKVINYGSFMQAYALKRNIEALGYRAEFRDFRSGEPRHIGEKVTAPSKLTKLLSVPGKVARAQSVLAKRAFRIRLQECFETDCWPLLGVTATPNYDLKADAFVIGSDEVFNYTQNHAFGYVPCLFGHGIEAPIIATYAASAGYANWSDVQNDGMAEELASGLRRMTHIAVRDENTSTLVQHCIGVKPTLVIDPTLIYDFATEMPSEPVIAPGYLLVYAYEGRMESANEIKKIKEFARAENLRIVSAGSFHAWCDENIVVKPFELLRLFADAAYVVTDTFHGSIFALKAGAQLATLIREKSQWGSNANKVRFLLEQFGMQSRIVSDMAELPQVLKAHAPYEVFKERLTALQADSREYLTKALARN